MGWKLILAAVDIEWYLKTDEIMLGCREGMGYVKEKRSKNYALGTL